MANHCHVKTKRKMKPELISSLLEEMNRDRFKSHLSIVREDDFFREGKTGWIIFYAGPEDTWYENGEALRMFWLNTSRSLEWRNARGFDWTEWLTLSIMNEIAVKFDGNIYNDGFEGKMRGKPGALHTFRSFLEDRYGHATSEANKMFLMQTGFDEAPEAFREDLGYDFVLPENYSEGFQVTATPKANSKQEKQDG